MYTIINTIEFPKFTGIKCNMMPFIQGDSNSIPEEYKSYSNIIDTYFLQKGEIGYLSIDEAIVEAGKSQRGFNAIGEHYRNVHIEVGRSHSGRWRWGSGTNVWGGSPKTTLEDDTEALIANSISNTCKVWNVLDKTPTLNGDLSEYLEKYPEDSGYLMKQGELAKISILVQA
jgi:hypothetical protein